MTDHADTPTPAWHALIETVRVRRDRRSSADRAWLSAVRAAIVPATESYAIPYTDGYLSDLAPSARPMARRAAAIFSRHPHVPHAGTRESDRRETVGAALRRLYAEHHQGRPPAALESDGQIPTDAMIQQINSLPLLDAESAAQALDSLIGRFPPTLSLDFHDLARTLIYWGNGVSDRSMAARQRVLTHFYSSS